MTNKAFIAWAHENLVVLIAHNELGHDPVEVKGYDGRPVRQCPLYPGMTCRQHCDASVDIETARDEDLVPVPFIKLCPNSWLVPPTGAPVRIPEADQFSPGKVRRQVAALRKTLGASVGVLAYAQVKNALEQAVTATEDDAWGKGLQALAGIATLVPKPHASLTALIASRLDEIDEPVAWALEEFDEGDEPLAERLAGARALLKQVNVAVYGKRLPVVATIKAWLKKHKT